MIDRSYSQLEVQYAIGGFSSDCRAVFLLDREQNIIARKIIELRDGQIRDTFETVRYKRSDKPWHLEHICRDNNSGIIGAMDAEFPQNRPVIFYSDSFGIELLEGKVLIVIENGKLSIGELYREILSFREASREEIECLTDILRLEHTKDI